jgi:hypothetical protein
MYILRMTSELGLDILLVDFPATHGSKAIDAF